MQVPNWCGNLEDLLIKETFAQIGPQAHNLHLRTPLIFELLDCSMGKNIIDFHFALALMVIQKSQYGLDSNLWVKSASDITIHLNEIAVELIIISMSSKVL